MVKSIIFMRTFRNVSCSRDVLFEMADCSSLHNVQKYPQQNLKYFTKRNFSLRLKTGKTGKLFEG